MFYCTFIAFVYKYKLYQFHGNDDEIQLWSFVEESEGGVFVYIYNFNVMECLLSVEGEKSYSI